LLRNEQKHDNESRKEATLDLFFKAKAFWHGLSLSCFYFNGVFRKSLAEKRAKNAVEKSRKIGMINKNAGHVRALFYEEPVILRLCMYDVRRFPVSLGPWGGALTSVARPLLVLALALGRFSIAWPSR
jgi:hypothetical protein